MLLLINSLGSGQLTLLQIAWILVIIVDLSAKQSMIAPGHTIQEFEFGKIVSRD